MSCPHTTGTCTPRRPACHTPPPAPKPPCSRRGTPRFLSRVVEQLRPTLAKACLSCRQRIRTRRRAWGGGPRHRQRRCQQHSQWRGRYQRQRHQHGAACHQRQRRRQHRRQRAAACRPRRRQRGAALPAKAASTSRRTVPPRPGGGGSGRAGPGEVQPVGGEGACRGVSQSMGCRETILGPSIGNEDAPHGAVPTVCRKLSYTCTRDAQSRNRAAHFIDRPYLHAAGSSVPQRDDAHTCIPCGTPNACCLHGTILMHARPVHLPNPICGQMVRGRRTCAVYSLHKAARLLRRGCHG